MSVLPDEPAPAPPQPAAVSQPPPKNELLNYAVAKKAYVFNIRKRFDYSMSFLVKKRLAEKEENKLAKMLAPLLSKFAGKKEQH